MAFSLVCVLHFKGIPGKRGFLQTLFIIIKIKDRKTDKKKEEEIKGVK